MSDEVYTIDDPRPIAVEAPYTYFLPSSDELAALAPDDQVKLCFRPITPGGKWDAERMWVVIESVDGDRLHGSLLNDPDDFPGLTRGDAVTFSRYEVIDLIWAKERGDVPPSPPSNRSYWARCLVDRCVIDDDVPIHFIYREEPEPTPEDGYPDSGWAIRGDYRGLSDAELDAREVEFVALGVVLNRDDSWLHLIDEPVGSAFIRDWENGAFVPAE